MARYITGTDQNVALNGNIPFNIVSIPCTKGIVDPVAPGAISLKGRTTNRFAQYRVSVQANIEVPEGGTVTPIALAITLNGTILQDSLAIFTPQAVNEYGFIHTESVIRVPCGCCVTVSAAYVDATEDDAAVTPTPSITVRRSASIDVQREA